jgi:hypothetical protein
MIRASGVLPGSGSGKILLIGSKVKKHLVFMMILLEFLLITDNAIGVKENESHKSFNLCISLAMRSYHLPMSKTNQNI